ncbi:2-methylisocitrate lyase-like PEP mutase family enzyme [Pseudochelatococcus lubricantis]|uniref:2-methylisocitrate lyase-like PEP mutase family enzyme n=1 Tax=Pseudochelatococcus lubricantis TaxID=1538102 RepID=A0ABX0UZN9_9HYPH|nr:isocitrate lyase/phosphoenolpyruvate mutase family protein [Pseudochelatococcus lubricantis]NIJ58373.1 2-methylisocitrate lyase-like PEP mutase family enzyme [Pseudochelatococcus lubricantis]
MSTIHERRRAFRKLHESSGTHVLPNPWNVGTARYLEHLGFKALSTTSAGIAFADGFPDTDWAVPRGVMLQHIREIVAATDLPVSADFESGYANEPEDVARNVLMCIETGVAGIMIEDTTPDHQHPFYPLELAVDRVRAARAAIDASGTGVVLTAGVERLTNNHEESLAGILARLKAYVAAGAEAVHVPGVVNPADITAIVKAVAPCPVSIVVEPECGLTIKNYAELGVRWLSSGSGMCRAAWGGFMHAAEEIAASGSFSSLRSAVPFTQINQFFRQDLRKGRNRSRG